VLVGTEYQRVEVYRRTEQGWGLYHIYGPRDEVEPTSVSVRLPVALLYQRTDVPVAPPEQTFGDKGAELKQGYHERRRRGERQERRG